MPAETGHDGNVSPRKLLRRIASWILAAVIVAIAVSVVGQWFIQVATDKGWYQNAGHDWDRLIAMLTSFATNPHVLYPTVALAGLVGGLWIDALLVRQEPQPGASEAEATTLAESTFLPDWPVTAVIQRLLNENNTLDTKGALLQVADQVSLHKLHVWGRDESRPLERINAWWNDGKLSLISGRAVLKLPNGLVFSNIYLDKEQSEMYFFTVIRIEGLN